ncbi:tetratricopeptide repeat protein [Paludisphaera mucosa]|uniref:Tetratricopeptide repeat protein n=1 Tax=Paludisphaera mucosa TaxID=3030827 RepID=A0ABT6F731_9BACT|nr:tetratricopeptide repeat protein [Paludisphaera mucosa]MDG3003369.1 tetratricopeptide repeat protein [Paludisphaera mucosa]
MKMLLRTGLGLFLAATPLASWAGDFLAESDAAGAWQYYNNMGWHAFYDGDMDLARDRFAKAIETVRPYEKKFPRLMSRSCHDLTRVLCAKKRYADAEPMAKWVIEAREHDAWTRDDVMFDSLYLLAVIHREQHHEADAVPVLRKAMAIEEKHVGPSDARLALTIKELADLEAKIGDYQEAEAHYRRAIHIHKRHAATNLDLAEAIGGRADVLERLGRVADARAAQAEAETIRDECAGEPRLADHLTTPLAARVVRPATR